jgi:hypothetical protein
MTQPAQVSRRPQSLRLVSSDLAAPWARTINRRMADSVAAILAPGRAVRETKAQLKHGGFLRLFADHRMLSIREHCTGSATGSCITDSRISPAMRGADVVDGVSTVSADGAISSPEVRR